MGLEADLYTILSTAGTAASTRVYPAPAPMLTSAPYVTWQRIAAEPVVSLSGSSGLDAVMVQFDCWATTRLGARTLALQIRAALQASARKVLLRSDSDDYDPTVNLHRVVLDFRVWDAPY